MLNMFGGWTPSDLILVRSYRFIMTVVISIRVHITKRVIVCRHRG